MKTVFKYVSMTLFVFGLLSDSWARFWRPDQMPNGTENNCSNCHFNPNGGGARNPFGEDVETGFLDGDGNVIWNYALARLDSDGDGIPNGVELQDPNAKWREGLPAPGLLDRVRNPGDAASNLGDVLTVQFSTMTAHVGEKFEIRLVDKSDRMELGRQTLAAIDTSDYQLFFEGVETGHSYWIDFYADHNGNGEYDGPDNDHAWRISVDDVPGDTIVTFEHNTEFTDIQWPYQLTVNFADMGPHVGQKFEIRLVDRSSRLEVMRKSLSAIDTSAYTMTLPALEINEDYWIDFYADLSMNGLYDAEDDHAWRLELEDVEGDTVLNFSHNGDFTNIAWPYNLTLQLEGMTPHIDQLFEIRVVDLLTGHEVGRTKLPAISASNFQVNVPGIDTSGYYQVDFYADFNGNGLYDGPGDDHAWRIQALDVQGDTTLIFSHNAEFTDIDWTYRLTLEVSDFSAHLNRLFEARLVEQVSGLEVGRARIEEVYVDEFEVFLTGMRTGTMYNVDFYADHNGNGLYDAPEDDHAWRETYSSGDDGDDNISFIHNTTFTDIEWRYQFTLNLTGMTPHVGQLFELRVLDQSQVELGLVSIDEIVAASFSVSVPGIQLAEQYQVDFYADHNGNGEYDAPDDDHAWREIFSSDSGNFSVEFAHNTEFTDIGFPTALQELVQDGIPRNYKLYQNFPNPFNPSTTIRFDLPSAGSVTIHIYNNLGQQVKALLNREMAAGQHNILWDGKDQAGNILSTGVYFYQIESEGFAQVRRMLLLK